MTEAVTDLAAFYTAMAPWFTNGTSFTVGDRVIVTGPPPNVVLGVTPIVVAGTDTGAPTAAQVAALLTYRGSFTGARYRGRKYIGPLEATAVDGVGQVSGTLQTNLLAAYDALVAALAANPHPTELGIYSGDTDTWSKAVSRTVSARPATLSSRS